MENSVRLLRKGFESSSGLTQEFKDFVKTFKKDLTKQLKTIGAEVTDFSRGHFYVSGFFKKGEKLFYFSLSDVRDAGYSNQINLLYRTARHNKDFTGGHNQYVRISEDMASQMNVR